MAFTVQNNVVLEAIHCGECLFVFALPKEFLEDRRRTGGSFYCPRGHKVSFQETENDRLRRQLKFAQARATHAQDQAQAAERSARAYKGQVTKIKKRVGNGVCPCCQRSFQNLGRHMANQHPGYADGEDQS